MAKNALEIEVRYIADLKLDTESPRIHSRAKRRRMDASLSRYGQLMPVLVDEHDLVLDGNLRIKRLAAVGETQVQVIVIANRSPAEKMALQLALNKLAMDATWDGQRLKARLEELISLDFDMELTGFDTVEIDMSLAIDETSSGAVEDAPPMPTEGTATTKVGDIWLLGEHRVACGDCRDQALVDRLLAGAAAQMTFADPPDSVAMGDGDMSPKAFADFLTDSLTTMRSVMPEGTIAFVCMDWRRLPELMVAIARTQLTVVDVCAWTKSSASMGSFYRSQHEPVFVLKYADSPHINNFELGQRGRSRSNVWSYRGVNSFGSDCGHTLGSQPTVKPVALVADAIKDVSHRGGIVFDPFLGSGATVIAAHRTGRRCFGIEIDPAYVDLVIRRWQSETGRRAAHAETGLVFDGGSPPATTSQFPSPTARLLAGPSKAES